jgi:hypothetical protein
VDVAWRKRKATKDETTQNRRQQAQSKIKGQGYPGHLHVEVAKNRGLTPVL